MYSLESIDIEHRFGDKNILAGFSFKAESGEIVFLAGENGAGKTTWIRIATGMLKQNKGSILFNSDMLENKRNLLSVVLDEPPVYNNLTGADNLIALSGIYKPDIKHKNEVLNSLKLDEHLLNIKAKNYSLGQRHRLSMAAALIRKPKYLILDEPTIGLDPTSWALIKQCLLNLSNDGAVIILTGQDFNLIDELVNKVVVLNNGHSVFDNTIQSFKETLDIKVLIKSNEIDKISKIYPNYEITENNNLIIKEKTKDEAEQIALNLNTLKIPFYELSIQLPSLKDCFQEMLKKD